MLNLNNDILRLLSEIKGGICNFLNNTGRDYCHTTAGTVYSNATQTRYETFNNNVSSIQAGDIAMILLMVFIMAMMWIRFLRWWASQKLDEYDRY